MSPSHIPSRPVVVTICGALAGAVFLLYGQVLRHEFINFDDDTYVTENPRVLEGLTWSGVRWAFTTTAEGNWHPLTWLSHMLDVQIFGAWPGGHHGTSVALHAANAILLFLALLHMSGASGPSALVAALFAIHPLRAESVAWVAERKDVLSGSFWMATLLAYSWYARRPGPWRYTAVFAAFTAGLLAKPMLVTLPGVFLLLDFWPLKRLEITRGRETGSASLAGRILEKLPLILVAAASSAITIVAQRRGGTTSTLDAVPLAARVANGAVSYILYLWKAVVPAGLAIFYPHPSLYGRAVPLLPGILAGAVLIAATLLVLRGARSRPFLATGWLWYLGTLVPVIGIVQVGRQAMADRYTYIPLVGIYVAAAWALRELVVRRPRLLRPVLGAISVVLGSLMVATWLQVAHFRDGVTLYGRALEVTADNYLAHNNLGVTLAGKGRLEEASSEYEAALRIKPDYPEAHNNLGTVLKKQGRLSEAEEHFKTAIGLRPDFEEPHANLGNVHLAQGDLARARAQYAAALRIRPDNPGALLGLGTLLVREGDLEGAARRFEEAVRLAPWQAETRKNLGIVRMMQGRLDEAVAEYRAALLSRPEDPDLHSDLGILYTRMGRMADAEAEITRALGLKPDHAAARSALSDLRRRRGD